MRYHHAILVMFGFITPLVKESESITKERIKNLRASSARHIGTILNQFRSLWPVECMPMAAMQYATIAIFTLFEDLDLVQNQKAFTDAVITLRALAGRWQFAKGLLRLVQLTTLKQETSLPGETGAILRDLPSRSGKSRGENDTAAWPL
jgi:hypothetical protein